MFNIRRYYQLILTFLLLLFCELTQAQNPGNKTLLWRITGNGLSRPSYLFGTMHLSDKRLFRFDDSVYHAIETTDGLAIELNPDELVAYYINNMFDQGDSKTLKELLGEDDYEHYSIRLEKKFKKSADKITQRDIIREKNRWVSDYMNRGQMPTFVDAYLYNIARKQNKWIGGIEDLSDQLGVYNEIVDKTDIDLVAASEEKENGNTIEKMIRLYLAQDIDGIDKVMSTSSHINKDILLTRRNVKMARRMDSLSAQRTMFFAVGAAHLPGDSGVIALLRMRGFKVSPVFSKKKIAADDYKFEEVPIAWKDIKEEQGLYSVKMPGTPITMKMHGLIDTKFMFDIFNMTSYSIMSVLSSGDTKKLEESYTTTTGRAFGGSSKTKVNEVYAGNVEGKEYINNGASSHARTRIFSEGNLTYFVMVSATKKAGITSPDADKFFDSFRIRSTKKSKGLVAQTIPFVNANMAISVQTTAPLSVSKALSNTDATPGMKVTTYAGTDIRNKAYILLLCKETLPGFYFLNDSEMNASTFDNIQKQYEATSTPLKIEDYNAMRIDGHKGPAKLKAVSFVRGNKNIIMMVITDSSSGPMQEIDQMLNSIHVLPYAPLTFKTTRGPRKDFSTSTPAAFLAHKPSKDYLIGAFSKEIETFDSTTSTTYIVSTDTLSKYYWAVNDSVFWNTRLEPYYEQYDDKIISTRKTINSKNPGYEWLIRKGQSRTYKRVRIVQHGNVLYTLTTMSEQAVVNSERSDKFFNDFQATSNRPAFSWKNSKTAILLKDLTSKDSATRNEAYNAAQKTTFTKKDVALLHKAMFLSYRSSWGDDTSIQINNLLSRKIAELGNASTIAFIKEKYATLTGNSRAKQGVALGILARMKTVASYNALFDLLEAHPLPANEQYQVSYILKEDLKLLNKYSARLLPMAKDTGMSLLVADWSNALLDSNYLYLKDVLPYETAFIRASDYKLSMFKNDTDYNAYQLQPMVDMLARFNDLSALEALKQYLAVNDKQVLMQAVLKLAKKGLEPDSIPMLKLASDSAICLEFYDALREINKESLFPAGYANQRHFAAAGMYNASIDDEEPSRVKFIKSTVATYNNKKYKFYLFRISYGEGEATKRWLGISGAYDVSGKKLKPGTNDVTGIYYDAEFDKNKLDAQLAFYLSNLERTYADPPSIGYNIGGEAK